MRTTEKTTIIYATKDGETCWRHDDVYCEFGENGDRDWDHRFASKGECDVYLKKGRFYLVGVGE